MRGLFLFLGAAALLCGGCARQYRDTALYQLSGRQKPIVAVLPIINHVENQDLKWDLSKELTDEIRKRVSDSKRVYLLREGGSLEFAKELSTPNPTAIPESAITNLGAAEFAVVAELIEQDEVPYSHAKGAQDDSLCSDAGAILSMALRVRVIDLRRETPKLVLQEVLDHDFVIARAYMQSDYSKTPWGTEAYSRTPMGMAHARIIRELVSRIEAYIEASL